jgi:MYXO-CTERM domain-containing protein
MFSARSMRRVRGLLMTAWIFAFTLLATAAFAAGKVQWKSTKIEPLSDGKAWRLECSIYLPKAPDVAHVPMRFEFDPVSYFERSMVDGKDAPVEREVPLTGRQALIESVDVGFLDSGTGKIESRTKFSFKITRAHGYEAGKYRVTIKDARNGQTVGTPTTLTFAGENEIIDRRSIVFTGSEGKKKKKKADEDGGTKEGEGEGDKGGDKAEGEEKSAPTSKAEEPPPDEEGPGEDSEYSNEKPGGCGCRLASDQSSALGAALAALGGLALFLARRRSV